MIETIAGVVALAGATLVLLAGVGVLRFDDLYKRMHAATKATTVGLALVALAGGLTISGSGPKLALIVAAIFVTTPAAAHLVARAADDDATGEEGPPRS